MEFDCIMYRLDFMYATASVDKCIRLYCQSPRNNYCIFFFFFKYSEYL